MRAFLDRHQKRFTDFWWGDRGLSTLLFILFLLFFISPFIESWLADFLVSTFLTLLLVSGIANVTSKKIFLYSAYLVAGTALVFNILHQVNPSPEINVWWHLSAIAYFFLLIYVMLRQVFRAGPVNSHRVRGAIAVYLLIGLTWAFIYQLIALMIPDAFVFPASMTAHPGNQEIQSTLTYFSFVTMTTLGYGDVVPVSPLARVFVIFEALIGQLYPATLLARLVSLEIMSHQGGSSTSDKTNNDSP
jgi:voltage-gated potassium channel Kch